MLIHGYGRRESKTAEFKSWISMRERCLCPTNHAFRYYGGRGIKICKRWDFFPNFLKDMGKVPPRQTLDRIDPNGNYCKRNCRWISKTAQSYNRRGKANGSSKYKGVVKIKSQFRARIRIHGKLLHLGYFRDEFEAAEAYNLAAVKYFGEFAFLNRK